MKGIKEKNFIVSANVLLPKVIVDGNKVKVSKKEGRWFNVFPFRSISTTDPKNIKFNIDDYEDLTEDYFDKLNVRVPDRFRAFQIMFAETDENKSVGLSENNDCLYECLKDQIVGFAKTYPTPQSFKERLSLRRDEKVPLKPLLQN